MKDKLPNQADISSSIIDIEQPELQNQSDVLYQLDEVDRKSQRMRRLIGRSALAASMLFGIGAASGVLSNDSFTHSMPFIEQLQSGVNNLDNVLEVAGGAAFTVGLGAIGLAKRRAYKDPRFTMMDDLSSKEPSSDGSNHHPGLMRRALQATLAGKIPVMASVGVGLAAFSASIGTEVSNGPQRPIVTALTKLAPGSEMVVEYPSAMPMVESDISRSLTSRIIESASQYGVRASILNENLGQITLDKQTYSDLAFGVAEPITSPLHWNPVEGCRLIPIGVDKLGRIHDKRIITIDGVSARVVKQVDGTSATNRIGVVMDENAMASCLQKENDAPVHAVVLDTSPDKAKKILNDANTFNETSALISKAQYLKNSKNFWDANVKPITNVLALFSGFFAFVAMGSAMQDRLVRNRRELATKSVSGNSDSILRATELLRATKDGVAASIIGGLGSMATPLVVNSLESGFNASIGLKELCVGAAIGMLGTVGGACNKLIRPHRIINPTESTRVQ